MKQVIEMNDIPLSAISIDVGMRLRSLRDQRGIRQNALAQACEISVTTLNQIEHGHTSPTISTLNRIAIELGVPISAFFEVGETRQQIVFTKADQRTRAPFARGLLESLGGESFSGHVEPFILTLEAGGSSGPQAITHTGHEFVYCLRGRLHYTVEQSDFLLESGDSLLFAAHLHHRWRNAGSVVVNALLLISCFEAGEVIREHHISAETSL
jgi:transcriptional regulator with XRE-family HTH domain